MKKLAFAFTLPLFAFLSSCEPIDETRSFNIKDAQPYNSKIVAATSKHEYWTQTPYSILHRLLGAEDADEPLPFEFKQTKNPDGSITATVTQEGLQDDSVYGEKWVVTFVSTRGGWFIKSIKKGFKCRKGRGNSDSYSGKWCD